MTRKHEYHVYIMANRSKTLYVGATSDLKPRVWKHKAKRVPWRRAEQLPCGIEAVTRQPEACHSERSEESSAS